MNAEKDAEATAEIEWEKKVVATNVVKEDTNKEIVQEVEDQDQVRVQDQGLDHLTVEVHQEEQADADIEEVLEIDDIEVVVKVILEVQAEA